jgi:hypothetical protein
LNQLCHYDAVVPVRRVFISKAPFPFTDAAAAAVDDEV